VLTVFDKNWVGNSIDDAIEIGGCSGTLLKCFFKFRGYAFCPFSDGCVFFLRSFFSVSMVFLSQVYSLKRQSTCFLPCVTAISKDELSYSNLPGEKIFRSLQDIKDITYLLSSSVTTRFRLDVSKVTAFHALIPSNDMRVFS
jgi:hypothetical protein